MNETGVQVALEHLPFFIVRSDETDLVFIFVTISLALIVLGFGALYLTIQAWPDRLAKGAGKVQLQVVGILGLISLLTLNNAFWIAGLLVATIRIPDVVTPLREIAKALTTQSDVIAAPPRETSQATPRETSEVAAPPQRPDTEE